MRDTIVRIVADAAEIEDAEVLLPIGQNFAPMEQSIQRGALLCSFAVLKPAAAGVEQARTRDSLSRRTA